VTGPAFLTDHFGKYQLSACILRTERAALAPVLKVWYTFFDFTGNLHVPAALSCRENKAAGVIVAGFLWRMYLQERQVLKIFIKIKRDRYKRESVWKYYITAQEAKVSL
jgi:hypothetical protein